MHISSLEGLIRKLPLKHKFISSSIFSRKELIFIKLLRYIKNFTCDFSPHNTWNIIPSIHEKMKAQKKSMSLLQSFYNQTV